MNNAGIIENDVYKNHSFLATTDTYSGYKTDNIITEPIHNSYGDIVGVLELLNKDGAFDENDTKYMKFFAQSLSEFIDLINL